MITLILSTMLMLNPMAPLNAGQKLDIPGLITLEAIKAGVPVDLALAVAEVESNFDNTAVGKKGEIGLYQIMPYHGSSLKLKDPRYNIQKGIQILKQYQRICSDMKEYWYVCYNNGPNRRPRYPGLHPYAKKITEVLHARR